MADTLSLDIKASLTWLFQDAIDLTTISDAAKLEYSKSLSDGTGSDQADKLWHAQRTLAAGAHEDLDLTNLVYTLFGASVAVNLAKVKALFILNSATAAGDDLLVGGAAAAEWTAPFGAAGDKVKVPADSCLLLSNKKAGWAVTNGSADTLRISNPGAASITYRIALVGTSA